MIIGAAGSNPASTAKRSISSIAVAINDRVSTPEPSGMKTRPGWRPSRSVGRVQHPPVPDRGGLVASVATKVRESRREVLVDEEAH
jgi:hypothetical protein